MKMNYPTREILSMLPRDVRRLCLEFCRVMEYDADISQFTPMKKEDSPLFGLCLAPSDFSRNEGGPAPIFSGIPDMETLSRVVTSTIDSILAKLGETRTSMRMKAQLMGFAEEHGKSQGDST